MNILIIDDSPSKVNSIIEELNYLGYNNIDTAVNAFEGLNALKTNKYDLLILDNYFPDRYDSPIKADNGINVLRRLNLAVAYRDVAEKIKIIFLSSDDVVLPVLQNVNVIGCIKYNPSVSLVSTLKELLRIDSDI